MGTIPPFLIQERLNLELGKFENCFSERSNDVEFVGGNIEFYFRVQLDGRVEWVYPRNSTIGDRAIERCLLSICGRVRFPRPRGGGPAEFAWGFDYPPDEGVRPPVDWSEHQVSDVVLHHSDSITSCSPSSAAYRVTAYVAPGGQVIAAGVSTEQQDVASSLDCVSERVLEWTMPDPGSYPAKVSFRIP